MVGKSDTLYHSPLAEMVDFRFDERVVSVFPDMIQRSVPGYGTLISMIGVTAGAYAQADSNCYDLGCSLGAVSLAMHEYIKQPECKVIAVDNSMAMIEKAQQIAAKIPGAAQRIEFQLADILDVEISQASVVVMNFTLQFIRPELRTTVIEQIYRGLKPGGVLILSEKLSFEQQQQQLLTDLHHEFKRANGYSDLEISQKRSALENVLIPESLEAHCQRLSSAGFSSAGLWFQCFNFASILAVK
ncbi:carboxy-S-adenosyl-L-methionine synthase CmoA [Methylophaga lonarensis]|uniref:carboxy-S-adenosyl-L-methionine synthase CmoA n=1 Tax=Methylophaga lonarensis TaxID=999151 RepID=UPI003D2A28F3